MSSTPQVESPYLVTQELIKVVLTAIQAFASASGVKATFETALKVHALAKPLLSKEEIEKPDLLKSNLLKYWAAFVNTECISRGRLPGNDTIDYMENESDKPLLLGDLSKLVFDYSAELVSTIEGILLKKYGE